MGSIASAIGAGSGLLSGIGGLIGGGSAKNYGSAGDFSNANRYLGQEGGVGSQYGQQAASALGQYGADDGAYRSAATNYANYLQQDPYTDQYSTAKLAQANAGGADAYSRARANLMAGVSSAGLGGGSSAALTGGMAGIDSAQAGQLAGQQNQLALSAIGQHAANLNSLTGLYGGMQGQDYSRGLSAMGAEQGVDQSLAGAYNSQGQYAQGLELQSQQMANQSLSSGLGALGSSAGQYEYYQQPVQFGGGGAYNPAAYNPAAYNPAAYNPAAYGTPGINPYANSYSAGGGLGGLAPGANFIPGANLYGTGGY